MESHQIKILGKRVRAASGLEAADGFLKMVIRLRGNKPFIPRGLYRFRSFEEKDQWTQKMISR